MSSCVVFEAFGLLPNIVIYPNIIFIFYFNFFFLDGGKHGDGTCYTLSFRIAN